MTVTRRGFFGVLAGLVAGAVVPRPIALPGLQFHRDAFTLAMAPIDLTPLRLFEGGRRAGKTIVCRYDLLYGVAVVRPELACRVSG